MINSWYRQVPRGRRQGLIHDPREYRELHHFLYAGQGNATWDTSVAGARTLANNARVGRWEDLVTGKNWIQATAGLRPFLKTDLWHGQWAIEFTGDSGGTDTGYFTQSGVTLNGGSPLTIFAVLNLTGGTGDNVLLAGANSTCSVRFQAADLGKADILRDSSADLGRSTLVYSAYPVPSVFALTVDTVGPVQLYKNGLRNDDGTITHAANPIFANDVTTRLGAYTGANVATNFAGQLFYLAMVKRWMPPDEILACSNWFNWQMKGLY